MTNAIGTGQDPALQPAAGAARATDAAMDATRDALDKQQAEGRDAVQPAGDGATRGRLVDRTA
jgi:hypothetical protein